MYTTLETPAQPSYSLGPPYTNYNQPPYYNYRPHYTSDILTPPASTYTGFHRADSHPQPFAYDALSKFIGRGRGGVWSLQELVNVHYFLSVMCRPDKPSHQSVRCQWSAQ